MFKQSMEEKKRKKETVLFFEPGSLGYYQNVSFIETNEATAVFLNIYFQIRTGIKHSAHSFNDVI